MESERWTESTWQRVYAILERKAALNSAYEANFRDADAEHATDEILEALADDGLLVPPAAHSQPTPAQPGAVVRVEADAATGAQTGAQGVCAHEYFDGQRFFECTFRRGHEGAHRSEVLDGAAYWTWSA